MNRSCLKSRPTATRPPLARPGLLVEFDLDARTVVVKIAAGDLYEMDEVQPLANLAAHVLGTALRRGVVGTA